MMKTRARVVAGTVGTAVAAATVGYVAGVLTAPAKGAATRRRLRRQAENKVDDFAQKARASMKVVKARIPQAIRRTS